MKHPLAQQCLALPGYLGGKRKLLQWIAQKLNTVIPYQEWPGLSFIDLFMGGGSVSLWAKAQGFDSVISNDISYRSKLLAQAFLVNKDVRLTIEDVFTLTQALPGEILPWIENTYAGSVFSKRHAKALDQGFYWARQHPDTTKRALLLTVMWHLSNRFVSFATSLNISNRPFAELLDGKRSVEDINPKRFQDGTLARLCEPTWSALGSIRKNINGGILGGSPVRFYQKDAITLLPTLEGDILYADPPYVGTANYEQQNGILDALLQGSPLPIPPTPSAFSKTIESLHLLLDNAQHIPIWMLSFGNQQLIAC